MIGWYAKDITHDNISHYYDSEFSLCKEFNLLEPVPLSYTETATRCGTCRDILKSSDMANKMSGKKSRYDSACITFEERHNMHPSHIIKNYLTYPHKFVNVYGLSEVVEAVSAWGGRFDWKTCLLLCVVSGEVKPGVIRGEEVKLVV